MDTVDKQITVVMLEHTGMKSVPDLSVFRNAQKLYLHENQISEVQEQVNDTVEDIDLSHNQLSYIPKIGGRSTFKLNMSHNNLRSCLL